jgi:hypothetical protein
MKSLRRAGVGLVAALAASAALAGTASSAEYNVKGLPELGRCLPASPKKTGNYGGTKCIKAKAHGRVQWTPAGAGKPGMKLMFHLIEPKFESSGAHAAVITCNTATSTGEYTGEKTFHVNGFTLVNCLNPAVSGEKTYCQTPNSLGLGEVEVPEMNGELGFITKAKKNYRVGFSLSMNFSFECEGGVEELKEGTGTGTKREIEGSAIGQVPASIPLDEPVTRFSAKYEAAGGVQKPESFEGGAKEMLTTTVSPPPYIEKTPEPTVLIGGLELNNEVPIEIKVKCKGC